MGLSSKIQGSTSLFQRLEIKRKCSKTKLLTARDLNFLEVITRAIIEAEVEVTKTIKTKVTITLKVNIPSKTNTSKVNFPSLQTPAGERS